MTMNDEMDRDLERTRPSAEPAGARAGATYRDDGDRTERPWRPEEGERAPEPGAEPMPAQAEPTPAQAEPMPAQAEPMPAQAEPMPAQEGRRTPAPVTDGSDLLGNGELTAIRDRWDGLQAMFVDDPAGAVRQADTLLGDVLDNLQRRHRALHDETNRGAGGEADTEDLRADFLRYRSFFRTLMG